ncbi:MULTISPECIES: hypothetical protein [Brucella]|nr:hypothetical protein [Brucella abortus]
MPRPMAAPTALIVAMGAASGAAAMEARPATAVFAPIRLAE